LDDPMIRIKRVSSEREKAQAFALRLRVFVKEQGVPAEIELDPDDRRALHFIARASGEVVGTARIVMRGRTAKIGRMAVLKKFRGQGIGARLLKRAIATATKVGAVRIYLHAQVAVIGFYERLHFHCTGPVFDEAGIAHRKMVLKKQKVSEKSRQVGKNRVTRK
jgi:predicted GNAT family N-acyltransferase